MVQPSLQYYPLLSSWNPGCSFVFSMALNPFWQGSIMYHVGIQQALTTSFVHTESNRPNFICNLTVNHLFRFLQ
ncbi:hypothetical protein AB6A40_009938 [Gnathostoma spinigerum]|uniref:Uncharacterized protein n=1 Tax=Gnathostoma spinigerum TaxID=75299 RepID=A0ABD6EYL0_9BILA